MLNRYSRPAGMDNMPWPFCSSPSLSTPLLTPRWRTMIHASGSLKEFQGCQKMRRLRKNNRVPWRPCLGISPSWCILLSLTLSNHPPETQVNSSDVEVYKETLLIVVGVCKMFLGTVVDVCSRFHRQRVNGICRRFIMIIASVCNRVLWVCVCDVLAFVADFLWQAMAFIADLLWKVMTFVAVLLQQMLESVAIFLSPMLML